MTDQTPETTTPKNDTKITRVFKIGSVRIVEDESMRGKDVKTIQKLLAPLYPQVENATVRERTEGDTQVIDFIQQAGRKG